MMTDINYLKAIELLHKSTSSAGFLASAQDISNYKRVWARDGVICGLAALASGDEDLIETFRDTLETLANNQHHNGTIPSNVGISDNEENVSYGGLAGRVDAVTWFIIGVCQYAYYTNDVNFVKKYNSNILKALQLLEAWEFNNKGLLYVPLSGNWADEYITDGYVLYDQLLRVWALKSYNHFVKDEFITTKIQTITEQIEINFMPQSVGEKYHERAYEEVKIENYMPCSFSPAGYKIQFDAFANSLALLLNIGSPAFQQKIIDYSISLKNELPLGLLPAFWPPVYENDNDWHLLKNNCKYEFRNFPNEFHNGGSWSMVNGFFGLALLKAEQNEEAIVLLDAINKANAVEEYSFYENFNSETKSPNGVPYCTWSAAATVMLHQSIYEEFKYLV
ncbi:glycoside hydrolase 100 family protein [Flavobacterium sp. NG2]|uniref:glycoside hydrolase 100 family protein n=1 Tax=Flavobacterium sp. NG2 TaxID=3097547 RepID=UPI002A8021A3|nr:glycoside hydrolase 100 family protein [Flavobacterium sp. NG2]WPR71799.1 glycoside hydrolase 100 family protein [Flavobacterium sp. NG2]